jgi:hypothetical protein
MGTVSENTASKVKEELRKKRESVMGFGVGWIMRGLCIVLDKWRRLITRIRGGIQNM